MLMGTLTICLRWLFGKSESGRASDPFERVSEPFSISFSGQ